MRKIDKSIRFLAENKEMSAFVGAAMIAGGALCCANGFENERPEGTEAAMVQHVDSVKHADSVRYVDSAKQNVSDNDDFRPSIKENPASADTYENQKNIELNGNADVAFRFSTFEVPNDGVLIERKERGDNKESVIYILDYHTNSKVVSDYQRNVQTEIFEIVKGLVEKYESVPVAMEVWHIGDTASNYRRRSTDSANIGRLFSASTLDRRIELVPSLMRDTKIVGPVIVGTFRDAVVPIGTVSEEDQRKANELVRMDRKLTKATSDRNFCTGTDGKTYSFYESKDAFRDGGSAVTDHCYCAVHEYEKEFVDRFSARLEDEPKKEVRLALSHEGNFSVVVAGYKHWQSAREELESKGANYAAIAPRTLAPGLDEKLNEDHVKTYFPDSDDGRCDALRRENAQLLNNTLRQL